MRVYIHSFYAPHNGVPEPAISSAYETPENGLYYPCLKWIREFFGLIFDYLDALLVSRFIKGFPESLIIAFVMLILIPMLLLMGIK